MARWADNGVYEVLKGWGISKNTILWAILVDRTPEEAQADLETMTAYFGMVNRRAGKGPRWIPSDLPLFDQGLRFLMEIGTENDITYTG